MAARFLRPSSSIYRTPIPRFLSPLPPHVSSPTPRLFSRKMSNEGKTEPSSEGINEWKTRPPYAIHKKSEDFKALYNGSCHCGKVTYQLSRDKPLASKYCHCTTCQTLHGAPFQWAAIFHKEDINFTNGHHDLVWYESSEKTTKHKLPCKVTCGYCRSPIMDEGRNMILLFPSLIKFEGNQENIKKFEPTCHMFYGQRVVDIPDGKPKWSGINDDSELMEEDEEHETKKRKRNGVE